MNIDKWICRRYDTKNKGYVTIGDILPDILKISILISYSILFLNGARLLIFPLNNYDNTPVILLTDFEFFSIAICIINSIFIIGFLIFVIIFLICTTKIVNCKR